VSLEIKFIGNTAWEMNCRLTSLSLELKSLIFHLINLVKEQF